MPSKQRYCCICSNHGQKSVNGRNVSMHRFPSDMQRRRVWIQRCKHARLDFSFKNYDQTRICSEHFVGGRGPTPTHNLPSVFPRPDGSFKYYQTTVNKPLSKFGSTCISNHSLRTLQIQPLAKDSGSGSFSPKGVVSFSSLRLTHSRESTES